MLEPMKYFSKYINTRGFTLIELMITIAILAVLTALATPSFNSFFAKKRVEGFATELLTDLQYARSESAQRNISVQVTLGTNCYVIHALANITTTAATDTSCTQTVGTASTIGTNQTELKTVKVATGSTLSFSPGTGSILFDPVRGMAIISSGTNIITTTSSMDAWTMRTNITAIGRVNNCSPAGSGYIGGYSAC